MDRSAHDVLQIPSHLSDGREHGIRIKLELGLAGAFFLTNGHFEHLLAQALVFSFQVVDQESDERTAQRHHDTKKNHESLSIEPGH